MINKQFPSEVAAAVGQFVLQSQMGMPLNGVNLNTGKTPLPPQALSSEEYNALLQMPLWQMTGAQYKSFMESIIPNMVMSLQQEPPQKRYVYGIDGLAKLIGKSKNTAQRLKSSGIIDDAIIQNGRTIMIDAKLALELMHQNDARDKAHKPSLGQQFRKEVQYV